MEVAGEEMTEITKKKAGMKPTEKEIEDHYASGHAVFRNWCTHCVKGQAKNDLDPLQDLGCSENRLVRRACAGKGGTRATRSG